MKRPWKFQMFNRIYYTKRIQHRRPVRTQNNWWGKRAQRPTELEAMAHIFLAPAYCYSRLGLLLTIFLLGCAILWRCITKEWGLLSNASIKMIESILYTARRIGESHFLMILNVNLLNGIFVCVCVWTVCVSVAVEPSTLFVSGRAWIETMVHRNFHALDSAASLLLI